MRPYKSLHVLQYYNGRTTVRPYKSLHVLRYYNGRTTVRPYSGLHVTASRHIATRLAVLQRTHGRASDRASLQVVTRHGIHTDRYTSLWHLAIVLVAIPACHIVFDVFRNVVSLSTIPNNAIIIPWLPSELYLMLLCKR